MLRRLTASARVINELFQPEDPQQARGIGFLCPRKLQRDDRGERVWPGYFRRRLFIQNEWPLIGAGRNLSLAT